MLDEFKELLDSDTLGDEELLDQFKEDVDEDDTDEVELVDIDGLEEEDELHLISELYELDELS